MKELSFKRIATEAYEKALTACELAFGCLVIRGEKTVELFTFVENDDVVIIDEMLAVGAELIYNRSPI